MVLEVGRNLHLWSGLSLTHGCEAGEGSLKRTAKAVDAALSQIASSDLMELQVHIRSLVALTGSLHSLLLCKGYFQPLGLQVQSHHCVLGQPRPENASSQVDAVLVTAEHGSPDSQRVCLLPAGGQWLGRPLGHEPAG